MTADTLGGVWTYALELCRGLRPFGVEILLATLGRRLTEPQRRELARLDHVRLEESDYRLCWMPDPWADLGRAGDWLLRLEAEYHPDIVHLNDLGHGGLPWRAPVVLVAHSCVCSWWQAVKDEPAPSPDWDRYRQLVAAGVSRADLLVAPTRAMLQAFQDSHGATVDGSANLPGKSRVIANGLDWPRLMAPEHILRDKAPFILAAGRLWDEAKNLALLAAAAPHLPWSVLLAGEHHLTGGAQAASDTVWANVTPLGQLDRPQLAAQLQRAAVYALPARYEPFGLSVLEAARAGCALVLGDIPSLREVWGNAALFVTPNDATGLQQALQQLIQDDQLRQRLALAARQRAQRYRTATMADTYWHSYQTLLQTQTRHQPPGASMSLRLTTGAEA